jgi:hypothetical protein
MSRDEAGSRLVTSRPVTILTLRLEWRITVLIRKGTNEGLKCVYFRSHCVRYRIYDKFYHDVYNIPENLPVFLPQYQRQNAFTSSPSIAT